MANQECIELDVETVRAIGRHFDRHAAEREGQTVIGRAIAEREGTKRHVFVEGRMLLSVSLPTLHRF
jgi:hypothetical protein